MAKKLLPLLLLSFVFAVFLSSCSKNDDETETPEPSSTVPVVQDNVKIIDNTKLSLDLTPAKIDNGVYAFTFAGTAPGIKPGDIIVGDAGEGFIRTVTTASTEGNVLILHTTQGSMSELFKEGGFNFILDMTDLTQKKANSGFSLSISSQPVYTEGPLSIVLDHGQVDFDPNWFFEFNFNKSGLRSFELSAKNGKLNGDFTATVTASQATTLVNKTSSLLSGGKPYTKTFTKWVPAVLLGIPVLVPVKVVMQLDLVLDYSATLDAAITRQATFSSSSTFDLGVKYEAGQWSNSNAFSSVNSFKLLQRTGNAKATIDLSLTPKVSFKLYGQSGPYASVSLMEQLSGAAASPALDWDFKADIWLKSTVGVDIKILDLVKENFSKTFETEKLSYRTPYKIEYVSGNSQTGDAGKLLANPLKVRIVDDLDKPQSKVPVYFKVESGAGSVQIANILTDDEGYAETTWKLGASGEQKVTASAKKADGTPLLSAPVIFTASFSKLIGTWELISATPAIGTYAPDYIQCVGKGDIVVEEYRVNSGQLVITKEGGTILMNGTQKYNNLTIDSNCKIIEDLPDTFTDQSDATPFTYDDQSFFVKDEQLNTTDTYSYTLLSANRISILGHVFERK